MKLAATIAMTALIGTFIATPAAASPDSPSAATQRCGGGLSARLNVWEFQESPTAVAGSKDLLVAYGVVLHPEANAFISAEAKGYDAMGIETWYGLGTSDATLRRDVPWGNNLAHPAIRILNNGPALAPPVSWTC